MYDFSYYPIGNNETHYECAKYAIDVRSCNNWFLSALGQGITTCIDKNDVRKLLISGLSIDSNFENYPKESVAYIQECIKFLNQLADDKQYCFYAKSSQEVAELYSEDSE